MAAQSKPKYDVEFRDPKTLIPYERNSKLHTDAQVLSIAEQIKIAGFDQPIVIDRKDVIVKGHGRRLAAITLKMDLVPVYVTALDADVARAIRIGDNKVAEAPWLTDVLRLEFMDLKNTTFDIPKFTGFDKKEFDSILNGWSKDSGTSKPPEDPGALFSKITISCRPADKEKLSALVKRALEGCGCEGVSVS